MTIIIQKRKVVESVGQLKGLAGEAESPYAFYKPFFIALNGGLRSSKEIAYDKQKKKFHIVNLIDGSTEFLGERQLFTKSNIGKAIKKGCFFAE